MSDYLTLAELKNTAELMGFSFADYDASAAISAASRGIDEFCGRRFYPTSGTVTRYYSPRQAAYLDIDDLISVSTVATDHDADGTFEQVWAENTDFLLEPFNASLDGRPYEELRVHPASSLRFPCWPRSVAVTAEFGWSVTPAPVKQATTIMAMRLLRRAREAPFGVVGLGLDNAPVRISKVDPDVAFLLNPFIRGSGVLAA